MICRRFTYTDARSDKFWIVVQEGRYYFVNYGRINTVGQVQTKYFASDGSAENAATIMIRSKMGKGYEEDRFFKEADIPRQIKVLMERFRTPRQPVVEGRQSPPRPTGSERGDRYIDI